MGLLQVVDRCFDTPILTQGPHAPFNDVEPKAFTISFGGEPTDVAPN